MERSASEHIAYALEKAGIPLERKVIKLSKKEVALLKKIQKETDNLIKKVEDAHKKAAKSNLRFDSGYSGDGLYKFLTKAYGKPDSSTPLALRKCDDLPNFLKEKARQEAESLKTDIKFKHFAYSPS